jgi:hypothetical protein
MKNMSRKIRYFFRFFQATILRLWAAIMRFVLSRKTVEFARVTLLIVASFLLANLTVSVSDKAAHTAINLGFLQIPAIIATPMIAGIFPFISVLLIFYLTKQKEVQIKQYDRMLNDAREKINICLQVIYKLRKFRLILDGNYTSSEKDDIMDEVIELLLKAEVQVDRILFQRDISFAELEDMTIEAYKLLSKSIKESEGFFYKGNTRKSILVLERILHEYSGIHHQRYIFSEYRRYFRP